ncbi:MAG TPA: DUF433 domain-containing protein [Longimicrobium sp.]
MQGLYWYADESKLEKLLDVPEGFLSKLSKEDDWSFVIKSHALIEAAITQMLLTVSDPRVTENFRKLPLGGGRTGKLAFAEALGFVNREHRAFIDLFSELRNKLVHDVRSVSFSFERHFANLPEGDLHRWAGVIFKVVGGDPSGKAAGEAADLLRYDPRTVLAYAVLATLAQALFKIDPEEYDRALAEAKRISPERYVAVALALIIGLHALRETGIPMTVGPRSEDVGRPSPVLSATVEVNHEVLGGTPIFAGTRVPIKSLFDYLEGGHPLSDFLDDFPTVACEQVLSVLRDAYRALSG